MVLLFVSRLRNTRDSTKHRTATRPRPGSTQEGGNVGGRGSSDEDCVSPTRPTGTILTDHTQFSQAPNRCGIEEYIV